MTQGAIHFFQEHCGASAPLSYDSQHIVPDSIPAKCELRDVIHSPLPSLYAAHLTFSLVASNITY